MSGEIKESSADNNMSKPMTRLATEKSILNKHLHRINSNRRYIDDETSIKKRLELWNEVDSKETCRERKFQENLTASKITGLFYGTFITNNIAGEYHLPTAYAVTFIISIGSSVDTSHLTTIHEFCISDFVFCGYDFYQKNKKQSQINVIKTITTLKTYAKYFSREEKRTKISKTKKIILRFIVTLYCVFFYAFSALAEENKELYLEYIKIEKKGI
ncbi:hypothetical protein MXB_224 [Myxobolus squamalis]|nr:hypothetical protein MXB_224 [Myxobolus squamalis]